MEQPIAHIAAMSPPGTMQIKENCNGSLDGNIKKRRKLTGDERLHRNRERNRMHARKTRERKKNQTIALQMRINELAEEGNRLRQMVDEQYTASSLLGLSSSQNQVGDKIALKPSTSICQNFYAKAVEEGNWFQNDQTSSTSSAKRIRRSGKYSPQERERIRRERNRMHAKKTRDRKKHFFEISERIIAEMVKEAKLLREYLHSINILTDDDLLKSNLRDLQSKEELINLKTKSEEEMEVEEENGYEEENEEENEEPSVSGSDENEKNSSWSGSNDGSSNQDSSLSGETSRDDNTSSDSQTGNKSAQSSSANLSDVNGQKHATKPNPNSTKSRRSSERDFSSRSSQHGSNSESDSSITENNKNNAIDWPESYHHGIMQAHASCSVPSKQSSATDIHVNQGSKDNSNNKNSTGSNANSSANSNDSTNYSN